MKPMSAASHIMQNDSLASLLARDHDYVGSLTGEPVVQPQTPTVPIGERLLSAISRFIDSVPWEVWAILIVLLLGWIAYKIFCSVRLSKVKHEETAVTDEADDIYAIDYDAEMADAQARGDYSALVRLVYLRTLRTLADAGRIEWNLSKTPEQYASEIGTDDFRRMTMHFLRVRYGRFESSRELYDEMSALRAAVEKGGES